jgi:transposase
MGNVVSKTQQEQILALGRRNWSLRKIEDTTGCRRETIGRYLRAADIPIRRPGNWGHPPNPAIEASTTSTATIQEDESEPKAAIKASAVRNRSQMSLCEEHRAVIAAAVDKGVCAKVIHEELVGFKGGYASVKRFVHRLKVEAHASSASPLVGTITTGPGEEAQVDYGQGPLVLDVVTGRYRRTRLFAMTLGWSRKAVWLLSLSSSAEIWCELHEKAFRALGGTTAVVVLDNLKEGVADIDYCDPILNLQYAQMLRHYDVVAVPARVRDPDRKGKVESSINYAQLRLEHRKFDSLVEAQTFLDEWQRTVADQRVHGTTKRIVAEHFGEEASHLRPLPLAPCPRFRFGRRRVTTTGMVQIDGDNYPAPASHVGIWVQVQVDERIVRVVDTASGMLLVEHVRKKKTTKAQESKAAQKGLSSSPTASPTASLTASLVQRGQVLGQNIGALFAAIAAVDHEEFAVRRLRALLKHAANFGVAHVDVACSVALAAGAPTFRCVQAWLDHHKPIGLAQVDPLIRELNAYRDVVARCSSTTNNNTENP